MSSTTESGKGAGEEAKAMVVTESKETKKEVNGNDAAVVPKSLFGAGESTGFLLKTTDEDRKLGTDAKSKKVGRYSRMRRTGGKVICTFEKSATVKDTIVFDGKRLMGFANNLALAKSIFDFTEYRIDFQQQHHELFADDDRSFAALAKRMPQKELYFVNWACDALEQLKEELETHCCDPDECTCTDDEPNVLFAGFVTDRQLALFAAAQFFIAMFKPVRRMCGK